MSCLDCACIDSTINAFNIGSPSISITVALLALCLYTSSIDNVYRYSIITSSGISSNNLPTKAKNLAFSSNFLSCFSSDSALTNTYTPSSSSKASFFLSVSSNFGLLVCFDKDFLLAFAKDATSFLLMVNGVVGLRNVMVEMWEF